MCNLVYDFYLTKSNVLHLGERYRDSIICQEDGAILNLRNFI